MGHIVLWAILLFAIAIFLFLAEFFIPSGGTITVLAMISLIASVALGFTYHRYVGFGLLASASFVLPAVFYLAIKIWPHSIVGRWILIPRPEHQDDVLPLVTRQRRAMVGKFGIAKTKMLPSGAVVIEGNTHDALSEGMPIDKGASVKVVAVRGNHLIVKPGAPLAEISREAIEQETGSPSPEEAGVDMSDLDDPLAG